MAIFKDKTGRGEVNYAKSPVLGSDGTILFLNDHTGDTANVFAFDRGLQTNHLVFQLRGESAGVQDVSANNFSITESSSLVKRLETVAHNTKLKTFEFSGGKTISLTPKVQPKYTSKPADLGRPRLGRDQTHGSSPIETIIPVRVESTKIGDAGDPEVIISFWVYINEYGAGSDGGGSCVMEQVSGTARTFGVIISSEGELVFRWYDWGANSTNALDFQQIKTQRQLKQKNWYHVTIFVRGGGNQDGASNNYSYNTSGLDSKHQHHDNKNGVVSQVAIFIDGQEQYNPSELGKTSGTFTGTMSSDPLFPVVLGTGLGGHDNSPTQFQSNAHFNGRLAEVSYFYTHRLAQHSPDPQQYRSAVARALFTGKKQPTSGITNISERLLLRDLDQNSTHPTVKRSGDIRRLGNHQIQFDDSRAQTLKGSTLQYPTKLVDGDKLIDTIYSGYNNGNLLVQHTASIESYDTFYRRNDQPSHEPFVESRIFVDENSAFYQTGTLESVLPGFDRPLRQKDVVKIEFNNQQMCELGPEYAAANNVDRNGNNTRVDYMAYWNTQGFFEKRPGITFHDGGSSGKNTSDANILTGSNIGFITSRTVLTGTAAAGFDGRHKTNGDKVTIESFPDDYYQAFGRPTSLFGFPDGARYNATGSNLINMSDYISEPFLVEKIVYYFDDLSVNLDQQHQVAVPATGYGFDGFMGTINVSDVSTYGAGYPAGDYFIKVTSGLTGIHCFLMRQYDGKPSGSRNITYKRKVGPNDLSSTVNNVAYQTKESRGEGGVDSQRDLIDYFTRYFTNPNPFLFGEALEGSGPTRETTLGQNVVTQVTVNNVESIVNSSMAASSSISNMETFLLSQFNKNNCAQLEYIESLSPVNVSKNFRRVRLESTVKTAQQRDFTGAFMTNLPTNTAADAGIPGSWSGNAANNTNTVSSRHIVKGTSGKKNPISFEVPIMGASPAVLLPATAVTVEGSGDAPYILTPSDKLIFGVQAPSPKSSFQDVPNSSIHINTGKICIELYGSYVRNSQPRQFELNQLLNNDIVHEAIGAEPISDEFDLENLSAFTGSYVDEIMSGSITAPYRGFDAHTNKINDLARRVGSRASEGNVGNKGSLRRTLAIAAEDKTELDSFLFDLESIFKNDERSRLSSRMERSFVNDFEVTVGGKPAQVDFMLLGDNPDQTDHADTTRRDALLRPNVFLKTSYLFSRYHNITRVRQNQIFAANSLGLLALTGSNLTVNGTLFGYLDNNPESEVADLDGSPTPVDQRHMTIVFSDESSPFDSSFFANPPKQVAKFLFGLGNGVLSSHYYTFVSNGASSSSVKINDIRGFKYGISNLGDKKPKNIFRRDRYGQFRDMLEMAPNTAYVDDKSNTTTFPIEAQFFADDGSIAAPDATSCSNLSTNLTSSAPFFDRDVVDFENSFVIRNRGPLNNKVVDITIEI